MGAGRKKKTLRLKEKPQPQWTVNCSVSARNLRKSDLGAVIFGCKHNTFGECKSSQLFGLPSSHFSYVKNVTPGLTLFLFNYSNRKLHGIFEAASPGQLNINSYGWTADGKESTPYPAQVQFRVRKQCRPLLEEEFAPIIADNYYEPMLFWFELDRTQTSKLIDLFSSSPSQLPSITPSLNTAVWSTRSNALPASDSKKVGDAVKAPVSEEMADNPDDVGTEWDTWETTAVKPNQETGHSYASVLSGKNTSQETFHSYASILSSKNNSLPQKPWISFSKASSSSGGLQKEETLKTQASKVLSLSDKSNMEWESSCVSSYLPKEQQFEACSDGWDTEGNEEPVDKSSSIESPMQEQITDSLPLHTSNEFLPTVDVREESRWLKSFASDLHLQQYHEPNTEWKMSCITHAFDGESRPSEASMENDGREIHNDVETCSKDSAKVEPEAKELHTAKMAATATSGGGPDPLFGLRNNFYLGAFQAAINNSDVPNLSPEDAIERDSLVYRSYIALGSYQLVINEIDSSAATPLQAVKLLAMYLVSPESKETTISSLQEWLGDPAIGNNPILRLIAGTIFLHEEDYNEALKHTNAGGTMELHALNIQIFLKMHRSDYAEKQLRIMQQLDEDHTLTQLANAWLNIAVGGSKIQEAYLIFQDFSEKYQMTCLVLNGRAVCCMHMGNFDEAETLLLEALNKDAKDPETLANLVVCSLHLGKSASRFLSQLKLSHPDHTLVKRVESAEENFERALQTVA